ncbi:hypothetical protein ROLI_043180 [Roseobacter fucihabitans]|uniref:Diguanylate cyclase n=1 Tax=Roseobacter fucihabitans TaxID=1537242 RepID=A0ABZ2BYN7_9RHOB|nr:EAL domain-containing protein [Roseobacter litoralis]MBC6963796.1 Phytochrome-like protein cph2 [Roseobacter litoralis]MBC6964119.1 Phytochrome-like protein cph2 [Roseobacter litoralis]
MLSIAGALVFAVGFFLVTTWEVTRVEASQRSQLIEMTNGFVSVFAENRGHGAPVPATFRRMGIEQFTKKESKSDSEVRTTVRMPGRPGLELRTQENDVRIKEIIQSFVDKTALDPLQEYRLENGRLVGRTIYPSVAGVESCVSCHNEILQDETYEIGDVMGAFVVESDLTAATWRNAQYSMVAFAIALLAFGVLARRERRRMREVVDSLEARVLLEKRKVEAEAHATFLTSHDALTGLPNRAMFRDRLASEIANRTGSGVSVGLLDLDEFKAINDTLGHGAGDALLAEVALRLTNVIKENNGLAARFGGDEFAIVFKAGEKHCSPDAVGRAILKALTPVFSYKDNVIHPRCSIGIATTCDGDPTSPAELLQFADAALYEAKNEGKNLFKLFDETIRSSLMRRTEIGAKLADAVFNDDIRAVLQPKLCLATGKFMGFEALGRWRLGGEEISPLEFIPIAEKIGLIRKIDIAVLHKAAEFVVREEAATGLKVPLSTNISALNFRAAGLAEAIQDVLWQTKLEPDRLTLELTETVAVENWNAVQEVLSILRPMGVRASLDDFGTGHSSLSYLRRFKFEEIKIDRSFIRDIEEDKETRFLFESIVDMAIGLGSTLVVEGIETSRQASIVSEKGAHIGQGFFFSRPLELTEAKSYLQSKNLGAAQR